MGVVVFTKVLGHAKSQSPRTLRVLGLSDFACPREDLCKNYYSHLYFTVVFHCKYSFESSDKHVIQLTHALLNKQTINGKTNDKLSDCWNRFNPVFLFPLDYVTWYTIKVILRIFMTKAMTSHSLRQPTDFLINGRRTLIWKVRGGFFPICKWEELSYFNFWQFLIFHSKKYNWGVRKSSFSM